MYSSEFFELICSKENNANKTNNEWKPSQKPGMPLSYL